MSNRVSRWSQVEIAEKVGVTQPTIKDWIDKKSEDAAKLSAPESRQHFDVWQFATNQSVVEKRKSAEINQRPGATNKEPWGDIQHFDIWQFATIAAWTAEKNKALDNSAPESRQHFDIWHFATSDKDRGCGRRS